MDHDPLRRGFAEFVGTFALIFIGAGSIMTLDKLLLPAANGSATVNAATAAFGQAAPYTGH